MVFGEGVMGSGSSRTGMRLWEGGQGNPRSSHVLCKGQGWWWIAIGGVRHTLHPFGCGAVLSMFAVGGL